MPRLLDNLETAVLFRLARLLTLIIVAVGFAAIVGGIALYNPVASEASVGVGADEIRSELSSNPQQLPPTQQAEGSTTSAIVRELDRFIAIFDANRYDREQLRAEVLTWLQRLPDPDARVQFLSDMTEAVSNFSQQERGSAAYAFARIRFRKEADRALQANKISTNREQGKLYFLYGIGTVGLFSLVLVLLRIERNTRRLNSDQTFE